MNAPLSPLLSDFDDPVHDSQSVFRTVLQALARPAQTYTLPMVTAAPNDLTPAMAAIALTLLDFETPTWVSDLHPDTRDWLRFHTGCPIVETIGEARFAFVNRADRLPDLERFQAGEPEYPDRSCTLILRVDRFLTSGDLIATGPGIARSRRLGVDGLPAEFWRQWRRNGQRFPLGIDAILTTQTEIMGLPRTLNVEVEPCTLR